ncbi:hypothetical protein JT358_14705 [Micrococcales bacterium 31B]|nr:hypothetical protein [Micrococcales bacterium 31B]
MDGARVALVTCSELPELDGCENLVIEPLAERGIDARPAVWDDPEVDWEAFDAVVLRSVWDYAPRREEFLTWLGQRDNALNPHPVVRWNTDKHYLSELADAGLPIIPTRFIEPGEALDLDALHAAFGLRPGAALVIKPSIGAGSVNAGKYTLGDPEHSAAAAKLVRDIHALGAAAMVQPYLDSINSDQAETALMYFGGEFSHAIRKGALLHGPAGDVEGLFVVEEITPRVPSASEREVGDAVLRAVHDLIAQRWGAHLVPLTYARIDLVQDNEGKTTLMEVELTEPSLFLEHNPPRAAHLAAAIADRTHRSNS